MSRLTEVGYIKSLLARHGFHFSKSLGQNFLHDDGVIEDIIEAANLSEEDRVIEVGPGIGVLTEALAKKVEKVIAIEIDQSLLPILQETLVGLPVEVINEDILKIDFDALREKYFQDHLPSIVANLPYYITTPIIMRFLEEGFAFKQMTIMMQKEVAERIVAKPGTKAYGTLSVAVQFYTEVEIAIKVPKGAFIPAPNVDSAVITLTPHQRPPVEVLDQGYFFKTVKAAFSTRRKTLQNALKNHFPKDQVTKALSMTAIDPSRRAETLSMEEFGQLANAMYQAKKTA